MTKVATIGEILVEIMASESGNGFRQPVQLLGPFPSGAPAIFIDQVAKLGYPCGIISCVGDDDFGWVNLDRLRRDGVDVGAVEVMAGQTTGSAFVRYRDDGARDFVYNIKNSASGRIRLTEDALVFLGECDHLHVSGASLFSDDMAVVGFDEIVWAPLLRTGLTTVGQPAYDLGHESARLLLSRIEGYSGSPRTVLLPTTLNIRASSAPRSRPLKATAGSRPAGLPLPGAGTGRLPAGSRRSGRGG